MGGNVVHYAGAPMLADFAGVVAAIACAIGGVASFRSTDASACRRLGGPSGFQAASRAAAAMAKTPVRAVERQVLDASIRPQAPVLQPPAVTSLAAFGSAFEHDR